MAIVKIDVLQMHVASSLDLRHSCRESVYIGKIDVLNRFARRMILNFNANGGHIISVNGNIGKRNVLNERLLKSLICHSCGMGIGRQPH